MKSKPQYFLKDYFDIITKEYLLNNFHLTNQEIADKFNVPVKLIVRLITYYKIRRSNEQTQALSKRKIFEKYGVNSLFELSTIQQKGRETRKNKYGYEYTFQDSAKIQKAIFDKYGVSNIQKNVDIHSKTLDTQKKKYGDLIFKTTEFKSKSAETKLKMYGSSTYNNMEKNRQTVANQSPEKKEEIHNKRVISSRLSRDKAFNTMKLNNTYGKSIPEELLYKDLCNTYGVTDIIRQYKDSRYPFACDFYIKSIDKFIEFNRHWTHNDHIFNENSETDLDILATWKEKALQGHKAYATAIEVWTVRDPLKLSYAIKNNLNYEIIW